VDALQRVFRLQLEDLHHLLGFVLHLLAGALPELLRIHSQKTLLTITGTPVRWLRRRPVPRPGHFKLVAQHHILVPLPLQLAEDFVKIITVNRDVTGSPPHDRRSA
jgi:hypothetical protein